MEMVLSNEIRGRRSHACGWLLGWWLLSAVGGGCAGQGVSGPTEEIVYVCRESGDLVVGGPAAVPAVHPTTGRPTLLRALYCEQCRRWHPVPPPEVFAGHPLSYRCPRRNVPLSSTGPLPATVLRMSADSPAAAP